MNDNFIGRIKSVVGQVVRIEVESDLLPELGEVLTTTEDPSVRLEVYSYRGNIIDSLSVSDVSNVYRNMSVFTTGSSLLIPVGSKTLGRVMNLLERMKTVKAKFWVTRSSLSTH